MTSKTTKNCFFPNYQTSYITCWWKVWLERCTALECPLTFERIQHIWKLLWVELPSMPHHFTIFYLFFTSHQTGFIFNNFPQCRYANYAGLQNESCSNKMFLQQSKLGLFGCWKFTQRFYWRVSKSETPFQIMNTKIGS